MIRTGPASRAPFRVNREMVCARASKSWFSSIKYIYINITYFIPVVNRFRAPAHCSIMLLGKGIVCVWIFLCLDIIQPSHVSISCENSSLFIIFALGRWERFFNYALRVFWRSDEFWLGEFLRSSQTQITSVSQRQTDSSLR